MSEEMLKGKYAGENRDHSSPRAWFRGVQQYLREWVAEHADGRPDTWTLRGQSETA